MGVRNPKPRIEGGWGGMRGGGGSRFRVPRFYYAPLKFYLVTKKDTWEQHPANLIPPLTTKHDSALSFDGTPSLARCRDQRRELLARAAFFFVGYITAHNPL